MPRTVFVKVKMYECPRCKHQWVPMDWKVVPACCPKCTLDFKKTKKWMDPKDKKKYLLAELRKLERRKKTK